MHALPQPSETRKRVGCISDRLIGGAILNLLKHRDPRPQAPRYIAPEAEGHVPPDRPPSLFRLDYRAAIPRYIRLLRCVLIRIHSRKKLLTID
jgi:hypothetical protein